MSASFPSANELPSVGNWIIRAVVRVSNGHRGADWEIPAANARGPPSPGVGNRAFANKATEMVSRVPRERSRFAKGEKLLRISGVHRGEVLQDLSAENYTIHESVQLLKFRQPGLPFFDERCRPHDAPTRDGVENARS